MTRAVGRRDDQRGETLIELMMAMTILGTGVVAIVGGIGTSVLMSNIHRKQATAGAIVRTYAEAIESGVVAASTDPYVACPTEPATTYDSPAGFTAVPEFTAAVSTATYWTGSAFASTCTTANDSGVQKLTLTVTSSDSKVVETLDVIIRKP